MKVGQKLTVKKKTFFAALEILQNEMTIIGPITGQDGDVTFAPINSITEIISDYVNELDPPKRFFLPHVEDLFKFNLNGGIQIESLEKNIRQVLFGIRPCDVKALQHYDKFFSGKFLDNYYLDRRKNTCIICVACNQPLETCFCICTASGPSLEQGFDLQLTDLGDDYLIEVGNEKGLELLKAGKVKSRQATDAEINQAIRLRQKCDEQFEATAFMAKGIVQMTNKRIREDLWDELGFECFSCGGCTHLCPMCTCFDVYDCIINNEEGIRTRCWDSCQYSGFTREASGHNPRGETKERIKRRFFHKMSYQYVKIDGHHGCVGCGRCMITCLAINQLDVPAVLRRMRRQGQPLDQP